MKSLKKITHKLIPLTILSTFLLYNVSCSNQNSTSTSSLLESSSTLSTSSSSTSFSESTMSTSISEPEQNERVNVDNWNDYLVSIQKETYYKITNNVSTKASDTRFSSVYFSVVPNEKYLVSFSVSINGIYGILLTNENYEVQEKMFSSKNSYSEFNNVQITIPEGISYVFINSYTPKEITVKKHSLISKKLEEVNSLPNSLKLASVNCGQFNYVDETTSEEAYQKQWENLINDISADMFMLIDSVDDYSASLKTDDLFTLNNQEMYQAGGLSSYLRCASTYKPETIAIIPFEDSISGSSKTTARFYALRLTFIVGTKQIALYGLHLVAEAHISNVQQSDGSSLSQKLRQLQYASLIKDGKNYDECIFIGDFNAQRADEYNIFTSNGFTITNCSDKYGTIATLRDIPADSIIVSGGISINSFEVKNKQNYNLNTDHSVICSEISF